MSAQVAADLRAAAEVLRRDGWTQGDFEDAQGRHCLVGAFEVVTGHNRGRTLDLRVWFRRITGWWPVSWNDAPGRTADEVIVVLEAAAQAAEADQ